MSRINGEKARANISKKRRTAMREASRTARADANDASTAPKPGGRPMAARAARRSSAK
jgi:hypothetical protein